MKKVAAAGDAEQGIMGTDPPATIPFRALEIVQSNPDDSKALFRPKL